MIDDGLHKSNLGEGWSHVGKELGVGTNTTEILHILQHGGIEVFIFPGGKIHEGFEARVKIHCKK